MPYAFQKDGQWVEIIGAFATDQGSYPHGWAEAASPAERSAAGVVEIVEALAPALGHQRLTGTQIIDDGGVPKRVGVYDILLLVERKDQTLAAIRQQRWEHEQAGFTGPAGHVRTDDATQGKVTGALAWFGLTGAASADWELTPGNFVTVTLAQVQAMAAAIGSHVQACFTRSRQLSEAVLTATTHAELTAIDITQGWPS